MSKTGYFRIGVFALTAVLVASTGLVLIGSGVFKKKGITVETYLDEPVTGLMPGALVKYRGVEVGVVTEIGFVYQTYAEANLGTSFAKSGKYVVVRMEIKENTFYDQKQKLHEPKEVIESEVARGLFVRLSKELVSPVSYMEFDYEDPERAPVDDKGTGPDNPPPTREARGKIKPTWEPAHYYVPSVPSTANQVESVVTAMADAKIDVLIGDLKRLISHDLTPVLEKVDGALKKLGPTLDNVKTASDDFPGALKDVKAILEDLKPVARDLKEKLPDTLKSANELLANGKTAITDLNAEIKALVEKLNPLLDSVRKILDGEELKSIITRVNATLSELPELVASVNGTLKRVDRVIAVEQNEVNEVLGGVRNISHDIQNLTGYAKEYPSHILFGNPPPPRERRK